MGLVMLSKQALVVVTITSVASYTWLGTAGKTYGLWQPYMAQVTCNRRITLLDHFQDTRHIEFALRDPSLTYKPGDLLCIFPKQTQTAITAFLQQTGLNADSWVSIEAAEPPPGSQPVAIKVLGLLLADRLLILTFLAPV